MDRDGDSRGFKRSNEDRDVDRPSRGGYDRANGRGGRGFTDGRKRKNFDSHADRLTEHDSPKRLKAESVSPNRRNDRRSQEPGHREPPTGPRDRGFRKTPDEPLRQVSAGWIPDIEVEEDDELLLEVQKVMGFAGFKSTQNRQVPGNKRNHAIRTEKETQYRQYMNRPGGFNRPLSPSHD
ncbi:hypothetical protein ANO11243_017200 [Dothideomycetidae sp. 11243]|nr:hypothetical protein ANO11243_017200 [fungal sp. No.11243]